MKPLRNGLLGLLLAVSAPLWAARPDAPYPTRAITIVVPKRVMRFPVRPFDVGSNPMDRPFTDPVRSRAAVSRPRAVFAMSAVIRRPPGSFAARVMTPIGSLCRHSSGFR